MRGPGFTQESWLRGAEAAAISKTETGRRDFRKKRDSGRREAKKGASKLTSKRGKGKQSL